VDVTGQPRVVDEDHPAPETAVVGHVTHRHEEAVLAYLRPRLRCGGPVNGDVFANGGLGPHADAGAGAGFELEILGQAAESAAVADSSTGSDHDPSLEHDMVTDLSVGPDGHVTVDDREGTDADPGADLRPGIHDGRGVDVYFLPPLDCMSWS
jgi:hypothetical protein